MSAIIGLSWLLAHSAGGISPPPNAALAGFQLQANLATVDMENTSAQLGKEFFCRASDGGSLLTVSWATDPLDKHIVASATFMLKLQKPGTAGGAGRIFTTVRVEVSVSGPAGSSGTWTPPKVDPRRDAEGPLSDLAHTAPVHRQRSTVVFAKLADVVVPQELKYIKKTDAVRADIELPLGKVDIEGGARVDLRISVISISSTAPVIPRAKG